MKHNTSHLDINSSDHIFPYQMPVIESLPSVVEYEKLELFQYNANKLQNGSKIESIPIRETTTVVDIVFNGTLVTNGIFVSDQYNTHSLGFKFDNEEDQKAIVRLFEVFDTLPLEDWEEREFLKNDSIWFKLKVDKKNAYAFSSNVKLNAKKPSDANLVSGEKISIVANPRAYFNHDDKLYGVSFTVKRVTIVQ